MKNTEEKKAFVEARFREVKIREEEEKRRIQVLKDLCKIYGGTDMTVSLGPNK